MNELSGANFVAIELDESPDVSKREQLSLVFAVSLNSEFVNVLLNLLNVAWKEMLNQLLQLQFQRLKSIRLGQSSLLRLMMVRQ